MAERAATARESDDDLDGESIERVDPSEHARIGRYELCFHVASGGMASVFLARATGPAGFTRPVALKRIHPHLARRREFVAMFLDEARIAARINHPNVCTIHDFGEADGAYFIAMEYLVGVPLTRLAHAMGREERAGRSRFGDRRWQALGARIVADAAAGLHAAHELRDELGRPLGVVHRDVSPQNVFVTFDGAVKVVDFGIALARDRLQETETGTLKGKLGYMAPEQASSSPVDRRADVWALGVCLWEMLVGDRLFRRASPMETLKAVGDGPIPAPSSRRASIPKELDAIALRALSRDPEARHASARELARELEAFVRATGEPTGLSDLAEWMQPLFAEERAQKSEIVHTMLHAPEVSTELRAKIPTQTAPASAAPAQEGRVGHETVSLPAIAAAQEAAEDTASLVIAPSQHAATIETATITDETLGTVAPSSRRGPWWGAAAVIGAIAIVAAVATLASREEDDGETTSAGDHAAQRDAVAETAARARPASASTAHRSDAPGAHAEDGTPIAATDTPPSAAPPGARASETETQVAQPPPTASPRDPATASTTTPAREAAPRARRARPPEPRIAETIQQSHGWVTVAAVGGWAEVWEGERRLGETPTRIRLRSGRHLLRVLPFGRSPERRIPVTVIADETTPLVVPVR